MTTLTTPPTEDYVLYADRHKMLGKFHRRMLLCLLPILCLLIFVGLLSYGLPESWHHALRVIPSPFWKRSGSHPRLIFSGMPWFLVGEWVFLWWIVGRNYRKKVKPLITLSPQGMTIGAIHPVELRWDEVGEVRCYTLLYRYVGIVPRDMSALCRRQGRCRSWLLRMDAAGSSFCRRLGLFVASINISQDALPIPAEELAATIHRYQAAYGPSSLPTTGVWPPPPTASRR